MEQAPFLYSLLFTSCQFARWLLNVAGGWNSFCDLGSNSHQIPLATLLGGEQEVLGRVLWSDNGFWGVEDLPPKAQLEASARAPDHRRLCVVSVTSQLGLEKGCPKHGII